jgi:sugar/nucleoside kinase (ribokinase family)
MIKHLAFGIVIDDIIQYDGQQHFGVLGGGGPQTAWGMAAALQSGESVGLVALVGADLDHSTLAPMTNAGVNLAGLQLLPANGLTPRAWQEIDASGGRTHIWKVPPPVEPFASDWQRFPENYHEANSMHWGLHPENPGVAFAHTLTQLGRKVSLETFKPPEKPLTDDELKTLLAACTVFSPNWNEAAGIAGSPHYNEIIQRFRDCGGKILALRRGDQGADVWDLQQNQAVRVPAVPTTVVDTVGAGNAFCGALLVTLDQGLKHTAAHGVAAASYMVEQIGLPLHLPTPKEYQQRFDYAYERALDFRLL